jgi:hypothetical protein
MGSHSFFRSLKLDSIKIKRVSCRESKTLKLMFFLDVLFVFRVVFRLLPRRVPELGEEERDISGSSKRTSILR